MYYNGRMGGTDKFGLWLLAIVLAFIVFCIHTCKAEAYESPFGCRAIHSSGEDFFECLDGTVAAKKPSYTQFGCFSGTIEVKNSTGKLNK